MLHFFKRCTLIFRCNIVVNVHQRPAIRSYVDRLDGWRQGCSELPVDLRCDAIDYGFLSVCKTHRDVVVVEVDHVTLSHVPRFGQKDPVQGITDDARPTVYDLLLQPSRKESLPQTLLGLPTHYAVADQVSLLLQECDCDALKRSLNLTVLHLTRERHHSE